MSKSKIITYDLRTPSRDYEKLTTAIKRYSLSAKVTESCWIIVTEDTCVSIRDNLAQHIDSNDRLFVAALTGEAAWRKVICDNEALKERL